MFSKKIIFGISFLIFIQVNLLCEEIINKQYIEAKKFALEMTKAQSEYSKEITCCKIENKDKKRITIWQKNFSLSTAMGTLYFTNFYYSQDDDSLYLMIVSSCSYITRCEVIKIRGIIDNKFKNIAKVESTLFQIFDKQLKILQYKSFLYFIGNNTKKTKYPSCIQYSTITDNFYTCPTIIQLLHPYCPIELTALKVDSFNKITFDKIDFLAANFPYQIIVDGKTVAQKKLFNYWKSFNRNLIKKSFGLNTKWIANSIYNNICVFVERDKFRKLLRGVQITPQDVSMVLDEFCRKNKVKLTDLFKINLNEKELRDKICNDKNIQFNLAVSRWIEKNHMPVDKIEVTDTEIKKFYNDYKWAFCKSTDKNSEFYSLNEVKENIKKEIKRLKYYRLDELLTNTHKVKIIWEKPSK